MEKWIVEVEILGKRAWLVEKKGEFFPGATFDFVYDICQAQQYATEAHARLRARKVNVAYIPVLTKVTQTT